MFDLHRFFDDQWPSTVESEMGDFFSPRVDVKEKKDHYEITAELPGVEKEDIQIHVKDGILTLEAETTQEDKEEKEGKVIRQERRYGKFMRSFNLGGDVHGPDIQASFKNGVLKLKAPRVVEKEVERQRIEVK
jgi:HSP20 family protein